jgi:hypothetical protein
MVAKIYFNEANQYFFKESGPIFLLEAIRKEGLSPPFFKYLYHIIYITIS